MQFVADAELERFLREDMPYGDLTTRSLGLTGRPAEIAFRARGAMVACCTEEAGKILSQVGCEVTSMRASGTPLAEGEVMLAAAGPAEGVLGGWKVAQTLMEYAAGIATAADRIVRAARAVRPDVVVACTRKNFPGTKAVAIKSVMAGGATPHRLGLSETLLVFPEHRALMGETSLAEGVRRLKASCPEKKVVVEVTSVEEAVEAAEAGTDVIQLEKFDPERVARVAERLAGSPALIAAAGGVNAANAAAYAEAGARILVTSSPYFAPQADVKVVIGPKS